MSKMDEPDLEPKWAVKRIGIPVKGVEIDKKTGKVKPKATYRSVSQKIAARKKPKTRFKRGK